MMKKTFLFFVLLSLSLLLVSCVDVTVPDSGGTIVTETTRKITFVIDDNQETRTFSAAEKVVYPKVPEKENYIFKGWYYDKEGTQPANLGTSVSSSVTLYAVWSYDYEAAINTIFGEYIKSAVGIKVEHKKSSSFGLSVSTKTVSGSGVIFKEESGYYYILTNAHVMESISGYNTKEISVSDCFGNSYSAALLSTSEEYDLAMLRFEKGDEELVVLNISTKAAAEDDVVIAIGAPGGLDNSVTFGKVDKVANLSADSYGNLGFPVIWHSAPVNHGSSGGALLNTEFEIVGINYAVGTSPTDNEFLCGLAVGIDKVNEFLNK